MPSVPTNDNKEAMTTTEELPVPMKRFIDAYDLGVTPRKAISRWLRNKRWNHAYAEANEQELSAASIKLLDVFNAFMSTTKYSIKERAVVYLRVARILHLLDEKTIELWADALVREFKIVAASEADTFAEDWKQSYFFHRFCAEADISRYSSEYWQAEHAVPGLYNMIRLSGPREKHRNKPLVFESNTRELLAPHYNLNRSLSDREVLEAKGIIELHHVWRSHNADEKQKISRFVAAYAHEMPAVITLVESRYVDTLEELDSLMKQTGATPALSQGAL
jgi:hypothetical protein